MKKFKFLPTILMLVLCLGVLAVGVFALKPTKNTLKATVTVVSTTTPVKIEVFIDSTTAKPVATYDEVRGGVDIAIDDLLGENLVQFNLEGANKLSDIPTKKLIVRITNLSIARQLGAYFLNEELTASSQIATEDQIYTQDNTLKVADVFLPSYTILGQNNTSKTESAATQTLEIEMAAATFKDAVGKFEYFLYIEEYAENLETEYEKLTSSVITAPKAAASSLSTITPAFTNTTLSLSDVEGIDYTKTPNVVVPEGVKKIAEKTFNNAGVKKVVLPSTLLEIEDNLDAYEGAFYGSSLTSFVAPKNLVHIGIGAFGECQQLKTVILSNSVKLLADYSFSYCSELKEITIPGNVESICWRAFINCTKLDSLIIQNGVKEIGEQAFNGCSSLTKIEIPQSATKLNKNIFMGCFALEELTIPVCGLGETAEEPKDYFFGNLFGLTQFEGSTSVSQNAIAYNEDGEFEESLGSETYYIPTSLTKVNFTGSVVEVGAFTNCSMIETITFSQNIEEIKDLAFGMSGIKNFDLSNCIKLKRIGHCAFILDNSTGIALNLSGCVSLTTLGADLFGGNIVNSLNLTGCEKLNNVNELMLGDNLNGVKEVYLSSLKQYCEWSAPLNRGYDNGTNSVVTQVYINGENINHKSEITIQDGTTKITGLAFQEFINLKKVTIPNSVKYIGQGAFEACTALEEITLPFVGDGTGSKTTLGYLFNFGGNNANVPASLKKVVLTNCTTIPNDAFKNCSSITSITLPQNLVSIGASAFAECSNITSITLPQGLKSIGERAFSYTGITNMVVPNSVTSIGAFAFEGCYLTELTTPVSGLGSNAKKVQDNFFCNLFNEDGEDGFEPITQVAYSYDPEEGYIIYDEETGDAMKVETSYYIPTSLKTVNFTGSVVKAGAFSCCSNITEFTFTNNLTEIENGAFYEVRQTNIDLSNLTNLVKIGHQAFASWGDYEDIEINLSGCSNLSYLGFDVFGTVDIITLNLTGCINLTSVNDELWFDMEGIKDVYIPSLSHWLNGMCSYFNVGYNNENGDRVYSSNIYIDGVNITTLEEITIPYSVTSIGSSAFYAFKNLKKVTIPNSVTSIGSGAFSVCTSLTEVVIPNSVTSIGSSAFYYCASLTEVVIPNSVTSIGDNAFWGCTGLTTIEIPNSVTSIGQSAFRDCTGLTEIVIQNSVTSIGSYAFAGCTSLTTIEIPNSVTSIVSYAFNGCTSLTEIIIPNSVTSIGGAAFYGCTSLTSITIPNSVTSIGEHAFRNCTSLTSIIIPNSVTSIGNSAFRGCTSLTEIVISNSVTSIGDYAFSVCTSLTEIVISNSVTSIGYSAFYGCTSLTSITIPNSVTSIGSYAFYGCSGLTEITLPFAGDGSDESHFSYIFGNNRAHATFVPESLKKVTLTNATKINGYAFFDCTYLECIILPNTLTTIGEYAFCDCENLAQITIPNNVTSIEQCAFYDCTSLSQIILPKSLTSIGDSAFSGCNNLKIVVNYSNLDIVEGATTHGGVARYASNVYTVQDNIVQEGDVLYLINGNNKVAIGLANGSITALTLASNCTEVAHYAFRGYKNLTSVVIPNSVKLMGYSSFKDCDGLIEITLPFTGRGSGTDTYLGFIFGAQDSHQGTEVPQSLQKVILTNITEVPSYAFSECFSLVEIILLDSVTSIGSYAFGMCNGLTSITIPTSVTSIGTSAFAGCQGLTEIIYRGTTEQWNAVTIVTEAIPAGVVVYCTNGNVTIS